MARRQALASAGIVQNAISDDAHPCLVYFGGDGTFWNWNSVDMIILAY
jgi:hypothetical protein